MRNRVVLAQPQIVRKDADNNRGGDDVFQGTRYEIRHFRGRPSQRSGVRHDGAGDADHVSVQRVWISGDRVLHLRRGDRSGIRYIHHGFRIWGGPLDGIYTQAGPITPLSTTPVFGTHATDIIVANSGATRQAWIGFAAPLTPAGGEISVFGASNPSAFNEQEAGVDLGSAVAVVGAPEPASFAVLGVGILGLVATKRRRKLAATLPASP
jgi:hypothetical protein